MKKRIVALATAACCGLGLVGCGETEEGSFKGVFHSSSNSGYSLQEGGSDSTSVEQTAQATFTIQTGTKFSDGVAFIEILKKETNGQSETASLAIDTQGRILYQCFDIGELMPYQNGLTLSQYSFGYGSWVYDKENNAVISPVSHGYDSILVPALDKGLFLVAKREESFEGDRVSLGIINRQGEYSVPLSQTQTIAKEMNDRNLTVSDVQFRYVGNGIVEMKSGGYYGAGQDVYYYNFETDKITEGYAHYEVGLYGKLIKFDENNNQTVVIENPFTVRQLFDDAILKSNRNGDEGFVLVDYDGNRLMEFGSHKLVSQPWEWSGETDYYYVGGYFLGQVKNATGSKYCCLFKNQGELAFEPIRMGENDHFYALTEQGFVYKKEGKYFFYGLDGSAVEYPSELSYYAGMSEFSDGLALVEMGGEKVYINHRGEFVITGATIKAQIEN